MPPSWGAARVGSTACKRRHRGLLPLDGAPVGRAPTKVYARSSVVSRRRRSPGDKTRTCPTWPRKTHPPAFERRPTAAKRRRKEYPSIFNPVIASPSRTGGTVATSKSWSKDGRHDAAPRRTTARLARRAGYRARSRGSSWRRRLLRSQEQPSPGAPRRRPPITCCGRRTSRSATEPESTPSTCTCLGKGRSGWDPCAGSTTMRMRRHPLATSRR